VRVVLDSNVIVAAHAARGLCQGVFEACLQSHVMVTSDAILKEAHKSLVEKIKLPAERADRIVELVRENSEIVAPTKVERTDCRDRSDLSVLGTEVSGGADCIVTGDKDLLVLKKHGGIEILSPRDFWDRIKRS
jgi:putative PIN family toxin of toxin-antitoxin system